MSDETEEQIEDPLIGQTIMDSFRVEKKLGQGGMGAVYLAEHLRLKKKVALKCLHAGLASNPEVIKRFKNEAVAATSIGHPNIVAVMDMGRFEDGTFFMVLEFLEGRDWQEDLDNDGIQPVAKVAHVGAQVCAALEAASKKGIVHRDLKPENIFLVEKRGDKNFAKVLDFGISKILDADGGATKTGQLMGTPYYMAPEQVLGEKTITHLADVYALGVIFYQALCGAVPFEGETLAQIIMKIATQPTPALSDRVDGVPPELLKLIAAMMEKDPSARPQSFAEVAERLIPFLDDESPLALRAPGSSASIPDAASTQTVLAMPAATTIQERATQIPRWGWGAGAAGVLALFLLISGGEDEEGATDAQAEESGGEDVEEEAQSVRLQISTTPKGATLTLDGEEVKNPYDEELEKDSKIRELVVSAKGYKDHSVELVLSRDQMLSLALEKKPPSKAKKASGSGTSSSSGSGSSSSSGSGTSSSGSSKSGSSSGKNRDSTTSSGGKKAPKPLRDIHNGLKKLF